MLGWGTLQDVLGPPLLAAGGDTLTVGRWRHGDADFVFPPDDRLCLVLALSDTQRVRHRIGARQAEWQASIGRLTTLDPRAENRFSITGRADVLAVAVAGWQHGDLERVASVADREPTACARLVRQVLVKLHAQEMNDPLACDVAGFALRDALTPSPVPDRARTGGLTARQITQVRDLIEARLDGSEPALPSLLEMADLAGISLHHFAREFRRSVGLTPYGYAAGRRLARAEAALVRTSMPVERIACRCGFSSAAHLTQRFREAFGVTPGQMRRAIAGVDAERSGR